MSWRKKLLPHQYRDVSAFFRWVREKCLGRKYTLWNRFVPRLAPRSIPQPEIPRGPEYKLSKQYYFTRSTYDSVKPPVVAPVALGPPANQNKFEPVTGISDITPDQLCFQCAPMPGDPYWWDGHSYVECVPDHSQCQDPTRKKKSDCKREDSGKK